MYHVLHSKRHSGTGLFHTFLHFLHMSPFIPLYNCCSSLLVKKKVMYMYSLFRIRESVLEQARENDYVCNRVALAPVAAQRGIFVACLGLPFVDAFGPHCGFLGSSSSSFACFFDSV